MAPEPPLRAVAAAATVLVIDDEERIRRVLRISLASDGHEVLEAATADAGIELARSGAPHLVVLDLGLRGRDGMAVLAAIRGHSSVPVLVLSVRNREQDKIAALDAGANDYVTKPFSTGELLARCRNLLRQQALAPVDARVHDDGHVRIDVAEHTLVVGGVGQHLTPKEYAVLAMLLRYANRVVTQTRLLVDIWGPTHATDTHYLRIIVARLRQKLGDDPADPRYLQTEPGVGYRLVWRSGTCGPKGDDPLPVHHP